MHGSRSQTYIYSIYKVTNKQKKEGIGQKIIEQNNKERMISQQVIRQQLTFYFVGIIIFTNILKPQFLKSVLYLAPTTGFHTEQFFETEMVN